MVGGCDMRETEACLRLRTRVLGSRANLAQVRRGGHWAPDGTPVDLTVPRARLHLSVVTDGVGPDNASKRPVCGEHVFDLGSCVRIRLCELQWRRKRYEVFSSVVVD